MHILLAEDEPFLAQIYESFLVEAGHDVCIEGDGEQALFRMKNGQIELVVLDIIMPKKTGFEVLEARRQDPVLKQIPVIVLTGEESKETIERAFALGADDFFDKNTL